VPGWAVPPRVLLVDDDAVTRKLSSKFLQAFGCTTDVAVDGISAVNKMKLEKYDVVLMDIVMPRMDGVSATLMIRKFDPQTPIISMTSSSRPTQIMTYYSSGMNDILPKPFTRDGLLEVLEKHLAHLKVIKQPSSPLLRNLPMGTTSLLDVGPESASAVSSLERAEISSDVGSNVFESAKRPLDLAGENPDERAGKRSRFGYIAQ